MALVSGVTTEIDASGGTGTSCARISDTQMLVIYRENATTLGARVCDINTSLKSITPNAQNDLAFAFNMTNLTLVRMSSTKFMFTSSTAKRCAVLNVSGTTVTIGPILTFTDTMFNPLRLLPLTATTTLVVYQYAPGVGLDAVGRVLSIDGSDNITEGSRLILNQHASNVWPDTVEVYTTSTGAYFFQDRDDNFYLKAQIFTISGTSLALSGGIQTIYNSKDGWGTSVAAAFLSSTEMAVAHTIDDGTATEALANHIVTLAGSSLSAGATLELAETEFLIPENGVFTNNTTVLFTGNNGIDSRTTQLIKDGTTLTHTASDFIDISVADSILLDSIKKITDDFALVPTLGSANGTVLGSDAVTTPSLSEFTIAPMVQRNADIGMDGNFLYLGVINSLTFPQLIKISSALNADGEIVFEPGAGDNIGVECGRFSADTIWVAGKFGGTNVIEKSEDGGATFAVKDDATIGSVRSFVMGPDSDERLIVFDETNGDILETITNGDSWTNINSSVTPEINAIARLGENVQEIVFGNNGAANDSINYSVNSGDDLEDYQTGVYPNANATGLVVN